MNWILAALALLGVLAIGAFVLGWDEGTFTTAAVVGVVGFLAIGRLVRGAW